MSAKKPTQKYKEPPIEQGDLNKFLGTSAPPRQKSLNSLWKKSSTNDNNSIQGEESTTIPADKEKVVSDDDDVMVVDQPEATTSQKERSEAPFPGIHDDRKRKGVLSDDEDDKPIVSKASGSTSSAPKKPKIASPTPSPVKAKSTASSPIKSPAKIPVKSPSASASSSAPKIPAASSFFAPKPKAKVEEKSVKGKGKAKAVSEEPEDDVEKKAEEEEEDEDSESDDEGEAAGKLAEIFQSKPVIPKAAAGGAKIDWKAGEPVPYAALTNTFNIISGTTKRLEISAYLTHFLVEVIEKTPGDLLKTIYLCINRLCPDYEALELGIGESLLLKAIGESTGRKVDAIKADYKKVGDLGEVAQASRAKQATLFKPKPLTIEGVFKTLKSIAMISGNASQTRKVGLINKLLASCVDTETKFLIRSLEGKLRIGLAEKTVLVSLAHAIVTASAKGSKMSREKMAKELELGADIVKAVFSELPSYDMVIPALLDKGIHHLKETCFLTPGCPLKPMLAKPTKAITEVLDRFEGKKFTCEYKYDGERAQVHFLEDGSIKVFSRNSEDMSVKYPDIVVSLPAAIKKGTTSFVIDAEAVAWDKDDQRLLPFQDLSRRKRKDVKAEDIKVRVHLFAFDLLYLNGEPLLAENLERRRELLRESLQEVPGEFSFATSEDATNVEDIQIFLDKSIKEGCEGLMVKMLEGEGSSYEPSRRSIHWLKLKKDYLAGAGDSFDLVVIGADYGRGKRTNVYGAFHLALWDDESEKYQSICKIGTGFSDEALQSHWNELNPLELSRCSPDYDTGTGPKADVYFEAKVVWEVLAADLSLSPIYTAAQGKCAERGISLRFPRFIKSRPDKGPMDSTSPDQVADAYNAQATTAPKGGFGRKKGAVDDGDGFW